MKSMSLALPLLLLNLTAVSMAFGDTQSSVAPISVQAPGKLIGYKVTPVSIVDQNGEWLQPWPSPSSRYVENLFDGHLVDLKEKRVVRSLGQIINKYPSIYDCGARAEDSVVNRVVYIPDENSVLFLDTLEKVKLSDQPPFCKMNTPGVPKIWWHGTTKNRKLGFVANSGYRNFVLRLFDLSTGQKTFTIDASFLKSHGYDYTATDGRVAFLGSSPTGKIVFLNVANWGPDENNQVLAIDTESQKILNVLNGSASISILSKGLVQQFMLYDVDHTQNQMTMARVQVNESEGKLEISNLPVLKLATDERFSMAGYLITVETGAWYTIDIYKAGNLRRTLVSAKTGEAKSLEFKGLYDIANGYVLSDLNDVHLLRISSINNPLTPPIEIKSDYKHATFLHFQQDMSILLDIVVDYNHKNPDGSYVRSYELLTPQFTP